MAFYQAKPLQVGVVCAISLAVASCFSGKVGKDELRDPISPTGVSLGLQVNLAKGSSTANVVSAIYENGQQQALVGGDYFSAESQATDEMVVLRSIENLSGNYEGSVGVSGLTDSVVVATEHDPQVAREDRWYPTDELVVDPGPNQTLVGYRETFTFPDEVTLAVNQTEFSDRSSNVELSWTPGNGQQMLSNALVSCRNSAGEDYTYSQVNVLGADSAGTASIPMTQLVPNQDIINVGRDIFQQVYSLMSVALSATYGFNVLKAVEVPLSRVTITQCDIDLTLYREVAFPRPETVEGGYIIASTSDTLRLTYTP